MPKLQLVNKNSSIEVPYLLSNTTLYFNNSSIYIVYGFILIKVIFYLLSYSKAIELIERRYTNLYFYEYDLNKKWYLSIELFHLMYFKYSIHCYYVHYIAVWCIFTSPTFPLIVILSNNKKLFLFFGRKDFSHMLYWGTKHVSEALLINVFNWIMYKKQII